MNTYRNNLRKLELLQHQLSKVIDTTTDLPPYLKGGQETERVTRRLMSLSIGIVKARRNLIYLQSRYPSRKVLSSTSMRTVTSEYTLLETRCNALFTILGDHHAVN